MIIREINKYIKSDLITPKLAILAISNIIIIFILKIIFDINFNNYFVLNLDLNTFLQKPWSIFTFIWVHYSLFDLFFLLIFSYFTEQLFKTYFNNKVFLDFFFIGLIVPVIICFIFQVFFPIENIFLHGFSFGIYSVFFGIIAYNPKFIVSLFPFPITFQIYWLAIIFTTLNFISYFSTKDVNYLFYIISSASGFLYMKFFEQGKSIFNIFKFAKKEKQVQEKNNYDSGFYNTDNHKLDDILDKISKSGYENLTKEEKQFLFNYKK